MFLYKSTQHFSFFTKIWFSTYVIFYNDSNKYSLASIHTTTPSTQCFDYYQRDKDIYCRFPLLRPDLLLSFTPVKTFTQIPNPTLYLRNSGNRFPNHCIWLGLFLSQRIHLCLCVMVLTCFFLGVMTSPIYGNPDWWDLACIHDLSRYYPIDLPIPKSLSSDFVIASLKGTEDI